MWLPWPKEARSVRLIDSVWVREPLSSKRTNASMAMKWILLIFLPFLAGISVFVAFAQPVTAIVWIPSFIACVAVVTWYYEKHHQGESTDTWEVSEEKWQNTLAQHVDKMKEKREKSSDNETPQ